jgi:hypothetical protein
MHILCTFLEVNVHRASWKGEYSIYLFLPGGCNKDPDDILWIQFCIFFLNKPLCSIVFIYEDFNNSLLLQLLLFYLIE